MGCHGNGLRILFRTENTGCWWFATLTPSSPWYTPAVDLLAAVLDPSSLDMGVKPKPAQVDSQKYKRLAAQATMGAIRGSSGDHQRGPSRGTWEGCWVKMNLKHLKTMKIMNLTLDLSPGELGICCKICKSWFFWGGRIQWTSTRVVGLCSMVISSRCPFVPTTVTLVCRAGTSCG